MKKFITLIVIAILLLSACSNEKAKTYETIDIEQVQQAQDNGAIVLDVREVDEFEEGHIIGAINVPLSTLQQGIQPDLSKDEKYIVICRSGNRSIQASDILFDDGYHVVNVSEGMSSWTGDIE